MKPIWVLHSLFSIMYAILFAICLWLPTGGFTNHDVANASHLWRSSLDWPRELDNLSYFDPSTDFILKNSTYVKRVEFADKVMTHFSNGLFEVSFSKGFFVAEIEETNFNGKEVIKSVMSDFADGVRSANAFISRAALHQLFDSDARGFLFKRMERVNFDPQINYLDPLLLQTLLPSSEISAEDREYDPSLRITSYWKDKNNDLYLTIVSSIGIRKLRIALYEGTEDFFKVLGNVRSYHLILNNPGTVNSRRLHPFGVRPRPNYMAFVVEPRLPSNKSYPSPEESVHSICGDVRLDDRFFVSRRSHQRISFIAARDAEFDDEDMKKIGRQEEKKATGNHYKKNNAIAIFTYALGFLFFIHIFAWDVGYRKLRLEMQLTVGAPGCIYCGTFLWLGIKCIVDYTNCDFKTGQFHASLSWIILGTIFSFPLLFVGLVFLWKFYSDRRQGLSYEDKYYLPYLIRRLTGFSVDGEDPFSSYNSRNAVPSTTPPFAVGRAAPEASRLSSSALGLAGGFGNRIVSLHVEDVEDLEEIIQFRKSDTPNRVVKKADQQETPPPGGEDAMADGSHPMRVNDSFVDLNDHPPLLLDDPFFEWRVRVTEQFLSDEEAKQKIAQLLIKECIF
eukprot:GDKJ01025923.1.p1 GENE.GDKJ01025923.1~~GDKJ01025923.1.p1  ORF type:complete len:619 (-),score=97.14 GDKJ01025923.1:250-2106(-)